MKSLILNVTFFGHTTTVVLKKYEDEPYTDEVYKGSWECFNISAKKFTSSNVLNTNERYSYYEVIITSMMKEDLTVCFRRVSKIGYDDAFERAFHALESWLRKAEYYVDYLEEYLE